MTKMADDKVTEKDFEEALIILQNIQAGKEIGRFNFTEREMMCLDFSNRILQATLDEMQTEK
jgi:predicted RNA-binding protein associated with RNAse of E/G family